VPAVDQIDGGDAEDLGCAEQDLQRGYREQGAPGEFPFCGCRRPGVLAGADQPQSRPLIDVHTR
jgi:hypothetical protein